MKANQTRISLETAKIIKPIAKPSKNIFAILVNLELTY